MSLDMTPEMTELVRKAYFVWFTTVRADGTPQPTPVWFVQDGSTYLVYSTPNAQKIRNIQQNPKVALGFAGDDEANSYAVIMGTAVIDDKAPPIHQNAAYATKYAEGIPSINLTLESMARIFSTAIRITPTHVRGE
jgi:PPOX class probable F420-dependent enzyme